MNKDESNKSKDPGVDETTTYQIGSTCKGYCVCGHSGAAHGSNGFICCVCTCKKFELMPTGIYQLKS